ncbi:hypothetical protein I4U23_014651 [Adineta vaga]|nr:hypothetical protein I4U23_014651 [Adineta vaga]
MQLEDPNAYTYSRPTSSSRPYANERLFNDYSHSPPWKKPTTTSFSTNRFRPRHSPIASYDRLIQNSHFNQPLHERPLYQDTPYHSFHSPMYDSKPLHPSRSTDDLLSSPMDTMRSKRQSRNSTFFPSFPNNGFRSDSDFVDFDNYMDALHRSHDALHDFPDGHQNFPINRPCPFEQQQSDYRSSFVNSNEDRVPNDYKQTHFNQKFNDNNTHDRSHSPVSQRDESPVRPPPPASQQQQQQQQQSPEHESDFKVTKNATNSMPKSSTTATSSQSNDQQVPSAETPPIRDPNVIALEKLEQIKQSLVDLNQQVDGFAGSTRDDRLYKLLDEQALKMMIRCDELIDVSADVKEKRKEMVRNVQSVLAKLESKVPINPSAQMETNLAVYDPSGTNSIESHEENTST